MYQNKKGKLRQDLLRALLHDGRRKLESIYEASRVEVESSVVLIDNSMMNRDRVSSSVAVKIGRHADAIVLEDQERSKSFDNVFTDNKQSRLNVVRYVSSQPREVHYSG